MSMRKIALAFAATALACAALPAFAAATPHAAFSGSSSFTTAGGVAVLKTPEAEVTCQTNAGTGSFDATGETGSVSFSFHECRDPFNTTCQTPGDPSGTITTTTLPFHLKTENVTGNPPLIQITSNNGHFATFECAFGLVSIEVVGNGILGRVTSPAYGTASTTFGVSFTQTGGAQTVRKTVEDGATEYDLKAKVNGGAEETATEVASGTGTIAGGGTTTLTKT